MRVCNSVRKRRWVILELHGDSPEIPETLNNAIYAVIMFRTAITALAATLVLSSAATAQDAFDWTGVYGGVSYTMGYEPTITDPSFADDTTDESEALGFFGGYNHQFGQYVVGTEIHAMSYRGNAVLFSFDSLSDLFEARIRGGYAFDRVLVTASVGYASQSYIALIGTTRMEGITYGIGVDYALPNNLLVGAEYVVRDMESASSALIPNLATQDESFRIRFGIRF